MDYWQIATVNYTIKWESNRKTDTTASGYSAAGVFSIFSNPKLPDIDLSWSLVKLPISCIEVM